MTTCQEARVKALAEEMSLEALCDVSVGQSVCQQAAETLGIPHRYCDPSSNDRQALDIHSSTVSPRWLELSFIQVQWSQ